MARRKGDDGSSRKKQQELNRGAWTPEENRKLAEAVTIHGAKEWPTIVSKAGLNRCAKSCRLRWMNYLRPNIKRGNMSDQEEDLIIRLHKLLGNRWSLIAARLPGRTDNEIKNYWNCHLSKKKSEEEALVAGISMGSKSGQRFIGEEENNNNNNNNNNNRASCSSGVEVSSEEEQKTRFDVNDFFDFSNENPSTLEWVTKFIEFGE
ncbi:hypothetical protein ABFS83_09G116400 [Erythranthe nasuta]